MAELNFTQVGEKYKAEFKIYGATNLHLERESQGVISIKQRGCETGQYANTNRVPHVSAVELVIDTDITADVYPKWILVESLSPVTIAEVTSESDVEIL